MKRLHTHSQYFLRNPRLIKELVGHSNLKPGDTAYDIGAGSGVISSVLATYCNAVVAVEVEPRMVRKLHENLGSYPNVAIHAGSFLDMKLPSSPYKVFANIPFHLSSPILRKLTESDHSPEAIYLVVQKQFANKLPLDSDRFTSQLGAMIGPLFAVRIRKRLKRTDFWPHPNVDTVFVELIRRDPPLVDLSHIPQYRRFIEGCFSDPKIFAKVLLAHTNIPKDIRPSQLSLEQWVTLFCFKQGVL